MGRAWGTLCRGDAAIIADNQKTSAGGGQREGRERVEREVRRFTLLNLECAREHPGSHLDL